MKKGVSPSSGGPSAKPATQRLGTAGEIDMIRMHGKVDRPANAHRILLLLRLPRRERSDVEEHYKSGSAFRAALLSRRQTALDGKQKVLNQACNFPSPMCDIFLGVIVLDWIIIAISLLSFLCCCLVCIRRWRREKVASRMIVRMNLMGLPLVHVEEEEETKRMQRREKIRFAKERQDERGEGDREEEREEDATMKLRESTDQVGDQSESRRTPFATAEEKNDLQTKNTERMTLLRAKQIREMAMEETRQAALDRSKSDPKKSYTMMAAAALLLSAPQSNKVSALIDPGDEKKELRGFGGLYGVEKIVGKHAKPRLGMRVTRCRPHKHDEGFKEFEKRIQAKGTVVWIDDTDVDGDGKTGDLTAVVWDATGQRDVHTTGLNGMFELALARGPEKGSESTRIFRKPVTLSPVTAIPWKGLGDTIKMTFDNQAKLHHVITLDRQGIKTTFFRGGVAIVGARTGTRQQSELKLPPIHSETLSIGTPLKKSVKPVKSLKRTGHSGSKSFKGIDNPDDVTEQVLGTVKVTLVGGQGLPLRNVKGFRVNRKVYAAVSVRGKEVLRTAVLEGGSEVNFNLARGMGEVREENDTVQIDVIECWGQRPHLEKVGSCRLYIDELWPSKGGKEVVCSECEGLGHNIENEKEKCESCGWSGMCFEAWVHLEVCANRDARVKVRCKFIPAKEVVDSRPEWKSIMKDGGLLPGQLLGVSAHDRREVLEWKTQIHSCKRVLKNAIEATEDTYEALTKALNHAKELGIYTEQKQSMEDCIEPYGKGIDMQALALARIAGQKIKRQKAKELRMPSCSAKLKGIMERWGMLQTHAQRAAVVLDVSREMQKLLALAAQLGMHRVERYKGTVQSAMTMLGDIERVLDSVITDEDKWLHEA